jgi:hypothetical protein
MIKLTNVQFSVPTKVPGGTMRFVDGLSPHDGHVEVLDFPWCRIVMADGSTRRTTLFNIAGCDDWDDEPEPAKGKAGK